MALTPEDVVNKRFQPTKFREGYDQDEVDDFLDEVVVELRRLNQENEELRQRLIASDSRISELQRSGAQAAPVGAEQPQSTVAAPSLASAPTPVPVAEQPAPPAPVGAPAAVAPYQAPGADSLDASNNTNNLLQLARRLHEEHVREGVEKRDALIAEGQATAAQAVAEGQATAAKVVAEAEAQQAAQLGALDQERTQLEHRIDELRTFEREYRQKLKGYIEGQLRELDATSAVLAGAPVGGTSASVGSASVGSASVGSASVGSAPVGSASTGPVAAAVPAPAPNFASPASPPPANYPGFASN
jgi:DivIVA domain-containing protein